MEEMLRADNITFSYTDDQHRAVDGLSLRVKRGEYVAVLGANGCGKSTLAKHFNAILLPQAGTVYVEDMSTADEDKLFDIRQKVGMVFQNPDNQICILRASFEQDLTAGTVSWNHHYIKCFL